MASRITSVSLHLSSYRGGGTYRWMAPELIEESNSDSDLDSPSPESDAWAFGMIVHVGFDSACYLDLVLLTKLNKLRSCLPASCPTRIKEPTHRCSMRSSRANCHSSALRMILIFSNMLKSCTKCWIYAFVVGRQLSRGRRQTTWSNGLCP